MKVPFVDIGGQFSRDSSELTPLIEENLRKGQYINSDEVTKLEQNLAKFFDVKHCICLNSGTDALSLSMKALGIAAGDEVITQANSFIASAGAIVEVGAIPVFADVLEDQSIDPTHLEAVITDKTKAIMPVHLTGRMADMSKIMEIAKKYNLLVIEDAAQSFGSTWENKLSGTFGNVGCFSAHPLKNFGACGDAGFVITNDSNLNSNIRLLSNHGLETRDNAVVWGSVSRMDSIQAVILNKRLKHWKEVFIKRNQNAKLYRELLNENKIQYAVPRENSEECYHCFVIQVDRRNELKEYLASVDIGSAIHYPVPIHLQDAAQELGYKLGSLPMTEYQANRILTLPIHELLTNSQIEYVAEHINKFMANL